MDTFLSPIETPKGLLMKLVYFLSRKQFGKVLTPLRIYSVRLPAAFGMFYSKVSKLDKKLVLSKETVMLLRIQIARLNICLFCIDIARSVTVNESMNQAKFNALEQYNSSSLFNEAERAALDYVTELTRDKKVSRSTFNKLLNYYSEREICEIVWLAASEHLYNISNIGLNIHSDMLCDVTKQKDLTALNVVSN